MKKKPKISKIIYFEGLFGVVFRWLYRGEIKAIEKHFNVKAERRHWTDKRVINNNKTIVIGHSFGAWAALKNTQYCMLLITFDVRNGKDKKYKKRRPHVKCANFYQQKSLLKGYIVSGARNFHVSDATHGNIVKRGLALKYIKDAL